MCIRTDLKVLYWASVSFLTKYLAVGLFHSPWRSMLSSTKGVITHTSVKWASRCTSFYFIVSALQLVCMHVYAAGDRPFSQKVFIHCFVYSLTSSTVLGAAGALGHICLLRRGHRHPTGRLLSSREEKDRVRLMLWLNFVFNSSTLWLYFLFVLVLINS